MCRQISPGITHRNRQVLIDLGNTYELINASLDRDHTHMDFLSPQYDGTTRVMRVEIRPHPDPFLAGVSNLAMGPLTAEGQIDDQIRLKHKDRIVVYSTLVFCMLGFLNEHPDLMVGLDGSDDLRAAMYHGIVLNNRNYLTNQLRLRRCGLVRKAFKKQEGCRA